MSMSLFPEGEFFMTNTSIDDCKFNHRPLAAYIDHTLLKPEAKETDIQKICQEAQIFGFYSVCVHSFWVPACKLWLSTQQNFNTKVITVVGFPLGANATRIKAQEAEWSVHQGAQEIDMVLNIGALKSRKDFEVLSDIKAVVSSVPHVPVKVIIETALLTEEEKFLACQLAQESGAQFIKTSTGFASSGAQLEDIKNIRKWVGNTMSIKASGGIRTRNEAELFLSAGANRLGTSSGPQMLQQEVCSSPSGHSTGY